MSTRAAGGGVQPSTGTSRPCRRVAAVAAKHERDRIMQIKMKTPLAALLATLAVMLPTPAAHAAILLSGDTNPAPGDEASITNTTPVYVGLSSFGDLSVNAGSVLASGTTWLGAYEGSYGTATRHRRRLDVVQQPQPLRRRKRHG